MNADEVKKQVREGFDDYIKNECGIPSEQNRMYGHHLRTFEAGTKFQHKIEMTVHENQKDKEIFDKLKSSYEECKRLKDVECNELRELCKIMMKSLSTYGQHPLIESYYSKLIKD